MEKKLQKKILYILQFIDSARFMVSPLSNFANNLSEGIHIIKCKYQHGNKKCKIGGVKYKYCNCFLEYIHFKDYLRE